MFILTLTVVAALGLAYAVALVAGRVSSVVSEAARKRAVEDEGARRVKLSQISPGGSPEHPIAVTSPSEVEGVARSTTCVRCGSDVRVEQHVAETIDGARLRVVRVVCAYCGSKRGIYFRIREPT